MILSDLKINYKEKIGDFRALTGDVKKGKITFIIYFIILIVPPFVSLLIRFNVILFLITALFSFFLSFLFLLKWRLSRNKIFINKYNTKYNLMIKGKLVSSEKTEIVQKEILKELLQNKIYNEGYLNKVKALLAEEILVSKKEFNIANMPFFNIIASVAITIITVSFINPASSSKNIDELSRVSLGIIAGYIYIVFIYLGSKFIIEGILNTGHERLKELLKLINHIELDVELSKI
jgi:hypothetical protein